MANLPRWILPPGSFIFSNTVITGTRFDEASATTSGSFVGSGQLSILPSSGEVTLRLSAFTLSLAAVTQLQLGSTLYNAIMNVTFAGSLVMTVSSSPIFWITGHDGELKPNFLDHWS